MKKYLAGIISFVILVVLDRLTKVWAATQLKGNDGISLIKNILRFQYLENHGAAFGIMQNMRILLLIITVVILCGLFFLFVKLGSSRKFTPARTAIVVLAAGAVGNMADRFLYGYVVDFIYFELINFPIFNVADCYVVVAAVVSFLLILFYYKEDDFDELRK